MTVCHGGRGPSNKPISFASLPISPESLTRQETRVLTDRSASNHHFTKEFHGCNSFGEWEGEFFREKLTQIAGLNASPYAFKTCAFCPNGGFPRISLVLAPSRAVLRPRVIRFWRLSGRGKRIFRTETLSVNGELCDPIRIGGDYLQVYTRPEPTPTRDPGVLGA